MKTAHKRSKTKVLHVSSLFQISVDIACDVQFNYAFCGAARNYRLGLRDKLDISTIVRGGDAKLDRRRNNERHCRCRTVKIGRTSISPPQHHNDHSHRPQAQAQASHGMYGCIRTILHIYHTPTIPMVGVLMYVGMYGIPHTAPSPKPKPLPVHPLNAATKIHKLRAFPRTLYTAGTTVVPTGS